jgi:hypothetical protein
MKPTKIKLLARKHYKTSEQVESLIREVESVGNTEAVIYLDPRKANETNKP